MSYDVKYDEITNFGFALNLVTGQTIEGLSSVISSLDNMINLDSFKGQTAEGMKSYMNEVSKTLVASAITVLSELSTQFLLYKDGYSEIDDNLHFRISEEKLADLNQFYRSSEVDFDIVHADSQQAINSVSDLVAVTKPNPTLVSDSYDETRTKVTRLREAVGNYESEHGANDFTVLNELISPLNALISEFAGKSNAPYDYTSMDIVNSSNFAALGNALLASVEKNKALADQIDAANDRENQRYEALVAEWAQTREEQGWLETVTGFLEVVGGVFVIIGSIASVAATGGASLPLAVAGVTAGIGMIGHGGFNAAEGIQDIYYGSQNNPFAVASNFARDTVFAGLFGEENKDKAWEIFGVGCTVVGTVATLGATGMAAAASGSARMAATGVCAEVVKAAGTKAAIEFSVKAGITMLAGAGSGYVGKEVARMSGVSDTVAETIGIVTAVAGATVTGYGMSKWQWSYESGNAGIPNGVHNADYIEGAGSARDQLLN